MAVGLLVFGLVILFLLLVADIDDSDRDCSSGPCSPAIAGTVDPVTCLPYGSAGAGTNNSGSSAQRQPKAPAPPPIRLTK